MPKEVKFITKSYTGFIYKIIFISDKMMNLIYSVLDSLTNVDTGSAYYIRLI